MRIGFDGSSRDYWLVLAEHGLEDLGEKLNRMSKAGQWQQMTAEISDDVVSDSASSELEGGMPGDLIQDILRIETPFRTFTGR